VDSLGGGTPHALVIGVILAVVVVIGAVVLAFVPLGGGSGGPAALPGPPGTVAPVPPRRPTRSSRNRSRPTEGVVDSDQAYACLRAATSSRPSSFTDSARIWTLRTLPVTVIGNSSTTRTYRGIL
jgi:hypothetical protein